MLRLQNLAMSCLLLSSSSLPSDDPQRQCPQSSLSQSVLAMVSLWELVSSSLLSCVLSQTSRSAVYKLGQS